MLYEVPQVRYVEPSTVEEAVRSLEEFGDDAKIIAGGTDMLGLMKDGVTGPALTMPKVLVSIRGIPGMGSIEATGSGLSIGAGVTLTELEESPLIRERYVVIGQAAGSVATMQIRNVGTVGGNLCQRPWCWYFRHPLFPCFKKGGQQCYAIAGEHQYYFSTLGLGTCVMSHPSDLAPALIALGGSVTVAGRGGTRTVPIGSFFNGPKEVADNVLRPGEMIVDVKVSDEFAGAKGAYLKDRIRGAWDLSLASCAVVLKTDGSGACTSARVVLGGVAPYPYRSEAAEKELEGHPVTEGTAQAAAEKVMEAAKALPMTRYKVPLGEAIVRRAILAAAAAAATG